jgi:uncharacterized phage-associated protein
VRIAPIRAVAQRAAEIGMSYLSPGIANEFVDRALRSNRPITAMHLQKFCSLSHGFTLAILDHPLTADKPEAWDYGPVYPTLYDALKRYGSAPVDSLICQNNWASDEKVRGEPVRAPLSEAEMQLIDTVWNDYGSFQAFQLSALTHEDDSPWAKIYRPGIKHLKIPDKDIKEYFVGLTTTAPATA